MEERNLLKPTTMEKILNSNTLKKKHPELSYLKVFKSRKGYSIGAKYESNKFRVTPKESELLKQSIKELLTLSSLDITFINIYYYRIFDREPVED